MNHSTSMLLKKKDNIMMLQFLKNVKTLTKITCLKKVLVTQSNECEAIQY